MSPRLRPVVPALALALALGCAAAPETAPDATAARNAASHPASDTPAPDPVEMRRMAITIDDLPVAPPGRHTTAQQAEITDRLLETLAAHGVPAIGFVNENKLEVDDRVVPERVDFLRRWLDAGHQLGNHGYAHLDLHRVDPDVWMADVLRGERVTRPLVEESGGELAWFRHPFLHVGMSVEVQEETSGFLAEHGYRIAPVTIDNGEWIYGGAYAAAWNRGDTETMARIGADYVRYMVDVVEYYEDQSRQIAGELIPQTLLIHAYALNADHLDELLTILQEMGYRWVTIDQAVEHPAYERPIHGWTGMGGITWLHRWAITEGMDRSIFGGEPEVPVWVVEMNAGAG